jgi:hypothetical protein
MSLFKISRLGTKYAEIKSGIDAAARLDMLNMAGFD